MLLLIGPRGDGLDVDAVLAEAELTRDVPAEHIDIVIALVTAYFLKQAEEPVPPTSPHIREPQRWQGEVCWAWLCERRGWPASGASILTPAASPRIWAAGLPLLDLSVACPARCRPDLCTTRPHQHHHTYDEGAVVANIKSQIKRNKQNEKRHERNKAVKSGLKTAVRKFREAAEAGDKEKAVELGRAANRQLDKAASKGVIHKNQAANRKSAISKKAASL